DPQQYRVSNRSAYLEYIRARQNVGLAEARFRSNAIIRLDPPWGSARDGSATIDLPVPGTKTETCRYLTSGNRIQTTSTRAVRARIRRVAGCATPTGFAGHAGATANLKLTFHLDHSAGADQLRLGARGIPESRSLRSCTNPGIDA